MFIFLWIVVACSVVVVLVEALRRAPFAIGVLVYGTSPIWLVLIWTAFDVELTPFVFIKIFSVVPTGILQMFIKYKRGPSIGILGRIAWAMAAINIIEVAATEASDGMVYNPIAGLLLILAAAGPSRIFALRDDVGTWAAWSVGWDWILVYTFWVSVFLYSTAAPGERPAMWMALAFGHLGVPILLARGRAERWAELRIQSLFFCMVWANTVPTKAPFIALTPWYHPTVAAVLQVVSLVLALGLVVRHVLRIGNPPPSLASTLFGRRKIEA